eukprot:COSAG03_NODE_2599_length_2607_cov_11.387560_2_plen_201_part_00
MEAYDVAATAQWLRALELEVAASAAEQQQVDGCVLLALIDTPGGLAQLGVLEPMHQAKVKGGVARLARDAKRQRTERERGTEREREGERERKRGHLRSSARRSDRPDLVRNTPTACGSTGEKHATGFAPVCLTNAGAERPDSRSVVPAAAAPPVLKIEASPQGGWLMYNANCTPGRYLRARAHTASVHESGRDRGKEAER